MRLNKWWILNGVLVYAILIFFPCVYIAGKILFLLNWLDPRGISAFEWLYTVNDYALGHLPGKKKSLIISGGVSFVFFYAIIPMAIFKAWFANQKRELHGSARWANLQEIRKADLLEDFGIPIGKMGKKILRFFGPEFVMVIAPTRSGKGVGIVIPTLLMYEHSCVINDIKKENFEITSGYRKNVLGQEVYLFDPFSASQNKVTGEPESYTHCYNPLDAIPNDYRRVNEIQSIATTFWQKKPNEIDFWPNNARAVFLGFVLFLMDLRNQRGIEGESSLIPKYPVTIGEVVRQAAGRGSGKSLREYLTFILETYSFLSPECRDIFQNILSNPNETFGNIISTFNQGLSLWTNPIVDFATSKSDFSLNELRKKPMSIYVGVTPNMLDVAAPVLNLFFSQLIKINTQELPEQNAQLKYSCLLLMDEFTSVGRLPIIEKGVAYMAGYGLRLMPIIQSFSQLSLPENYGQASKVLIENHPVRVVFPPQENEEAKRYSEMIGTFTERAKSKSTGKGGTSQSESDQRRSFMMPQELMEMDPSNELIFKRHTKPILAEKIRYYEDPFFIKRLLPAVAVPQVDVALFKKGVDGLSAKQKVEVPAEQFDLEERAMIEGQGYRLDELEIFQTLQNFPFSEDDPPSDTEALDIVQAVFNQLLPDAHPDDVRQHALELMQRQSNGEDITKSYIDLESMSDSSMEVLTQDLAALHQHSPVELTYTEEPNSFFTKLMKPFDVPTKALPIRQMKQAEFDEMFENL